MAKLDLDFNSLTFDVLDFNPSKNLTSDKLKSKAKLFLEKNNIRESLFKKKEMQILDNVLENFKLPKKNQQIRIRTQQQINLISILLKIIEQHKKIDALTITTYTLNRLSLETICDLITAKKIKALNLLISSSYTFRDKKYYSEIKNKIFSLSKKYKVHLAFAWCHFKITLARCGTDYYQHEGSMNYSQNNMAENLLIENNKETYNHDYIFLNETVFLKKNKAIDVIC